MKGYLFYDEVGEIKSHLVCTEEEAQINADALGLNFIEGDPAHPLQFHVSDGLVIERTTPVPTTIDEPTLEAVQQRQWVLIKQQREALEQSGLVTEFGVFDSDRYSQMNLVAQAIAASSQGEGFTVEWTLKDNTTVELNATQLTAVVALMTAFKNQLHATSQELRALIFAPDATVESVNSVTWPF